MDISTENIAFIGILFVALVGIWALVRSNNTIANLIPFPLVQELIRSAVETALDMAEERAALTETTADDELIRLIREEVLKAFSEAITESGVAPLTLATKAAVNKQVDERIEEQSAG